MLALALRVTPPAKTTLSSFVCSLAYLPRCTKSLLVNSCTALAMAEAFRSIDPLGFHEILSSTNSLNSFKCHLHIRPQRSLPLFLSFRKLLGGCLSSLYGISASSNNLKKLESLSRNFPYSDP